MNLLLAREYKISSICSRGTLTAGYKRFQTLELPWLDNSQDESCVPPGDYVLIPFFSMTHGHVWRLHNPDLNIWGEPAIAAPKPGMREGIEIHTLNYPSQTHGCIGPGMSGNDDSVSDSDSAMIALRQLMGATSRHTLQIVQNAQVRAIKPRTEFTRGKVETPAPIRVRPAFPKR